MAIVRGLCFVVGAAIEGDPDGLPVVGFQLELSTTAEHGHQLLDELLVFFHPNIIMFAMVGFKLIAHQLQ